MWFRSNYMYRFVFENTWKSCNLKYLNNTFQKKLLIQSKIRPCKVKYNKHFDGRGYLIIWLGNKEQKLHAYTSCIHLLCVGAYRVRREIELVRVWESNVCFTATIYHSLSRTHVRIVSSWPTHRTTRTQTLHPNIQYSRIIWRTSDTIHKDHICTILSSHED